MSADEPDLRTFEGACEFATSRVLPTLRTDYKGPIHPIFSVFATVDADDKPCEPMLRKILTDVELHVSDHRDAFANAARKILAGMGALGFVLIVDTATAGLSDDLLVVWLDHVGGSSTWIARLDGMEVGEFELGEYDLGDELLRMLPRKWMN